MTRRQQDYSARDIERAVEFFDWNALLDEQGISAYPRGDELVAPCPFCHHGGRASFFLNSVSGVFFCHVCGATGGPIKMVAALLDIRYSDAIARIMRGQRYGVEEDDDEDEVELVDTAPLIELPDEYLPLTGDTSVSAGRYRDYLAGRGIGPDLIEQYEIGFCALGHLAGFVIVPVYHLGRLVTYIARKAAKKARLKVWTPPGNEEGDYLFNLDHIWGAKSVVVMEGVFDALVLPDRAVATFGKKISNRQLLNLKAAGVEELVLCWDADAQPEVFKTFLRAQDIFRVTTVDLPDDSDPSDLGSERTLELVNAASAPTEELVESAVSAAFLNKL